MYAIFVEQANSWHLYEEFGSLWNAKQELEYVTKMLGLKAKIFRKSKRS